MLKDHLSEVIRLAYFNSHCCGKATIASSTIARTHGKDFQQFLVDIARTFGKCHAIHGSEPGKAGSHTDYCRRLLSISADRNSRVSYCDLNKTSNFVIDAVCDAVSEQLVIIDQQIKDAYKEDYVLKWKKKQNDHNSRHLKNYAVPTETSIKLERVPTKRETRAQK